MGTVLKGTWTPNVSPCNVARLSVAMRATPETQNPTPQDWKKTRGYEGSPFSRPSLATHCKGYEGSPLSRPSLAASRKQIRLGSNNQGLPRITFEPPWTATCAPGSCSPVIWPRARTPFLGYFSEGGMRQGVCARKSGTKFLEIFLS